MGSLTHRNGELTHSYVSLTGYRVDLVLRVSSYSYAWESSFLKKRQARHSISKESRRADTPATSRAPLNGNMGTPDPAASQPDVSSPPIDVDCWLP